MRGFLLAYVIAAVEGWQRSRSHEAALPSKGYAFAGGEAGEALTLHLREAAGSVYGSLHCVYDRAQGCDDGGGIAVNVEEFVYDRGEDARAILRALSIRLVQDEAAGVVPPVEAGPLVSLGRKELARLKERDARLSFVLVEIDRRRENGEYNESDAETLDTLQDIAHGYRTTGGVEE